MEAEENEQPKKTKLERMFEIEQFCYWCGRETFLRKCLENRATFAPDAATIDHIYNRYDREMRDANPDAVVIACYECNDRKGRLINYIYQRYVKLCSGNGCRTIIGMDESYCEDCRAFK